MLKLRQDEIYRMQHGAVQPHIYPSDIMRLLTADAPEPVWSKLENLLLSLYEKIAINLKLKIQGEGGRSNEYRSYLPTRAG